MNFLYNNHSIWLYLGRSNLTRAKCIYAMCRSMIWRWQLCVCQAWSLVSVSHEKVAFMLYNIRLRSCSQFKLRFFEHREFTRTKKLWRLFLVSCVAGPALSFFLLTRISICFDFWERARVVTFANSSPVIVKTLRVIILSLTCAGIYCIMVPKNSMLKLQDLVQTEPRPSSNQYWLLFGFVAY